MRVHVGEEYRVLALTHEPFLAAKREKIRQCSKIREKLDLPLELAPRFLEKLVKFTALVNGPHDKHHDKQEHQAVAETIHDKPHLSSSVQSSYIWTVVHTPG
jgi:hypothetical protein